MFAIRGTGRVPHAHRVIDVSGAHQIDRKLQTRSGRDTNSFGNLVDVPLVNAHCQIKDLGAHHVVSLSRMPKLYESFIGLAFAEQQVSQLPARMRVSGGQLNLAPQSLLAILNVTRSFERVTKFFPITIVVRRKHYRQLIFAHRVGQVLGAEDFLLELSQSPMRQRIIGRPADSHARHIYSTFFNAGSILGHGVADIPAHGKPRTQDCQQRRQ